MSYLTMEKKLFTYFPAFVMIELTMEKNLERFHSLPVVIRYIAISCQTNAEGYTWTRGLAWKRLDTNSVRGMTYYFGKSYLATALREKMEREYVC